jgi:hypothetical protein
MLIIIINQTVLSPVQSFVPLKHSTMAQGRTLARLSETFCCWICLILAKLVIFPLVKL